MNSYQKEDDLPDTPETVIQNYEAQAAALDGLVEKTAQQLTQVEQNLGWIFQQAEANKDENLKLAVNNTWALSNEMAVRVTQFDAARLASIAMMKKMADYNRKIAGELDDLEAAVYDVDEDHPALRQFGEAVREDERHLMSDGMFDDALEIAYENVFTELHEGIREATGCADWRAIYDLCDILTGSEDATDAQRHLIGELLNSIIDARNNEAAAS